ncbi:glycoside hydrolase family 5 protein [Mixia osmundae IAM 14324]|uniref:glucan 1,3-beta-glucosidase n=1 Tax=Mixia osmundae (strain CBS 9802 / IAM 14324 / JCM 22182 / KY 12970) TaxID=764103 RepID=G7DTY5_MIXOS|nr:glycoside hydrolase family 5 protein [Mixia osmundae IAM 14324]KEI41759.1 glycoside hydrolase family 5 protein [Mixia osmundae IAM 14324]GAA94045.1 hypothetical protein E5Q_00692 [Mixia osmundae IAM 14324]
MASRTPEEERQSMVGLGLAASADMPPRLPTTRSLRPQSTLPSQAVAAAAAASAPGSTHIATPLAQAPVPAPTATRRPSAGAAMRADALSLYDADFSTGPYPTFDLPSPTQAQNGTPTAKQAPLPRIMTTPIMDSSAQFGSTGAPQQPYQAYIAPSSPKIFQAVPQRASTSSPQPGQIFVHPHLHQARGSPTSPDPGPPAAAGQPQYYTSHSPRTASPALSHYSPLLGQNETTPFFADQTQTGSMRGSTQPNAGSPQPPSPLLLAGGPVRPGLNASDSHLSYLSSAPSYQPGSRSPSFYNMNSSSTNLLANDDDSNKYGAYSPDLAASTSQLLDNSFSTTLVGDQSFDEKDGKEKLSDEYSYLPPSLAKKYDDKKGKRASKTDVRTALFGSRSRKLVCGGLTAAVILAAIIGVATIMINRGHKSTAAAGPTSSDAAGTTPTAAPIADTPQLPVTQGGDGSTVTTETGVNFTYTNTFGGFWVSIPFNDSAQPQSDIPPLNQPWDFQTSRINGVNLGGWLVPEPFITPYMYEQYANTANPAIDEWTLAAAMGTNYAAGMESHYDTFVTEQDFAQIAGAGLNWIRLSVPFWMIETYPGEPYLEGVAFKYFLKAITWARKYGIRINLDLHTAPGSQNGWNHSGRYGSVNFLMGQMGVANAQRMLNYIRTLAEFISQPQYRNVVPMFGIINEPQIGQIGTPQMRAFYVQAYQIIRDITGVGMGNGPIISMHDGFQSPTLWYDFLTGADRLAVDSHTYMCFGTPNNNAMPVNVMTPCNGWSGNTTMNSYGFAYIGEWSLAVVDCGQYVNGVNQGSRYSGTYSAAGGTNVVAQVYGDCDAFTMSANWTPLFKAYMTQLALTTMDVGGNTFFWTWKSCSEATCTAASPNPMWSYMHGLREGYVAANPRWAPGTCQNMAAQYNVAQPAQTPNNGMPASATGGQGAGQTAGNNAQQYPFPPASITNGGVGSRLPAYTPTGAPLVLTDTATPSSTVAWTAGTVPTGWYTAVAGQTYPDAYSQVAAANRKRSAHAEATAMPVNTHEQAWS